MTSQISLRELRDTARHRLAAYLASRLRDSDAIFEVAQAYYNRGNLDGRATFTTSISVFRQRFPINVSVSALKISVQLWTPRGRRLGMTSCEFYRATDDAWVIFVPTHETTCLWPFDHEQTRRMATHKPWENKHTPCLRGSATAVLAFIAPEGRGLSSTQEAFPYLSTAIEIQIAESARVDALAEGAKAALDAKRALARARKEARAQQVTRAAKVVAHNLGAINGF